MAIGPVTLANVTDQDGKFNFAGIPPGNYTVRASFSGLEAEQTVKVEASSAVQVRLEMRPSQATTTATVQASETASRRILPPLVSSLKRCSRMHPIWTSDSNPFFRLSLVSFAGLTDTST